MENIPDEFYFLDDANIKWMVKLHPQFREYYLYRWYDNLKGWFRTKRVYHIRVCNGPSQLEMFYLKSQNKQSEIL